MNPFSTLNTTMNIVTCVFELGFLVHRERTGQSKPAAPPAPESSRHVSLSELAELIRTGEVDPATVRVRDRQPAQSPRSRTNAQMFQLFETLMPFPVKRITAAGGDDLPPEFEDRGYHVLDSGQIRAVVEAVVHEGSLVNFNLLVFPKEWLKARAIQRTFVHHLAPYCDQVSRGEWRASENPPCLLKHDQERGLFFQYRCDLKKRPYLGFSIFDDRFA